MRARMDILEMIHYCKKFGIPKAKMADAIEQKISLLADPSATSQEIAAAKRNLRAMIEELVSRHVE